MLRRLLLSLQGSVLGSAMIIGVASVASRLLGLLRDRLLFSHFGAGHVLDSYFTAFKIPDFFFNIVVLGTLSASFVPVFIEFQKTRSNGEAHVLGRAMLTLMFVVLGGICILLSFFSPTLVHLLAFGDIARDQALIARFLRIMVWSLLLFGVSNVVSGMLHASRRFVAYAIAPIFYNVGIIVGLLFFVPLVGNDGLPLGVVFGALLHLCVQLPALRHVGFRFRFTTKLFHPGVRTILRLMPPRAFALGVAQLNIMIMFALASTLEEGSRAVWQGADNLQNFPINIFGVSLALAVFPLFSEAFAENNVERFKKVFSENFRRILFFIIPTSIATLLLRAQIVRLIYGTAAFDWNDTVLTAQTLGMFALSMFAQATIPLLARSFFAKQDTRTPVLISTVSMIVNVGVGMLLMRSLGIIGLAFAFSLAAMLQMLALLVVLRMRHGDLDDDHVIASTWKIVIAALGMGIVVQGLKYTIAPLVDMQTFVGVFLQTSIAMLGGASMYITIAHYFHFAEARAVAQRLRRMLNFLRAVF